MKMQEIREMKTEDLVKELALLEGRLREHRFGLAVQQQRNISAHSALRRTIARIKTELAQRAAQQAA